MKTRGNIPLPCRLAFMTALGLLAGIALAGDRDEDTRTIATFEDREKEDLDWSITDDGVMGGLSKGKVAFSDGGTMLFSGTLSLENNGGFSSVWSKRLSLDISAYEGLQIRVKGDGRTYQLRMRTDERYRGDDVSFRAEFATVDGEWVTRRVPFSAFQAGHHGRDLQRPFDPAKIEGLGHLLADKQAGPFTLEVDWIRAYADGDAAGKVTTKPAEDVPDR